MILSFSFLFWFGLEPPSLSNDGLFLFLGIVSGSGLELLVLFLGLDGDKELVSLLLGEAEGGPGVHVLVWLSLLKSSL